MTLRESRTCFRLSVLFLRSSCKQIRIEILIFTVVVNVIWRRMEQIPHFRILNDPLYRTFAWWSAVLTLKIILMVPLIGRHRFGKKIFISPEDTKFIKGSKVSLVDPDIERVRRAHLNDLENILPWALSTMLWLTTSPDPALAAMLIKTFGISRLLHTFVYAVCPIRQPARFLAFAGGYVVTFYQTLATIYHYA